MQIYLPPPAPEQLRRLEAAAAARPGVYRFRLAVLALAGDAILTFVRVLPLAGPIVLAALFINHPFFDALAVVATLLLIWLMRPGDRDHGEHLERSSAAELYAVLDDLKMKLDVGGPIDVRLEDEVNASAREMRGLFGLVGTRRVLTLGVPLLALLDENEARAVIAHEFGHFSRRHGRLGHWLYWAHLGWLSYAEQIDKESSILERLGGSFAESFVPAFSRRAMVWSRGCEYEADSDAASAVGGEHVVSALARLALFDAWQDKEFSRIVRGWQCSEAVAPDNWLERMMAAFEATPSDVVELERIATSRSRDWLDTHPGLAQRAAALGVPPRLARRGEATGSAVLGGLWPTVTAEYDVRWRNQHAVEWSLAHTRYRLIEAALLAADSATAAGWPIAQRLQRARALRKFEPERGLSELEALHAAQPDNRSAAFAYAAAGLAEGDARAVETMRALAKEDASWRVPVCARLVRYHDRIGDRAGANRWAEQLEVFGELEARAHATACNDLAAGRLEPTTHPAALIKILHAGFVAEPAVAKAWLVEGRVLLAAAAKAHDVTVRVDALILVVDPFDAERPSYDLDAVRSHQQSALSELIEPNALPVVMIFYATESLPAALEAALEQLPAGGTYVR